jgi:FAD synthetase
MRVMVFGTFDLLHPGHRSFLRAAESLGEVTVVVARSSTVRSIKGKSPIESEGVRRNNVAKHFPSAMVVLGEKADFLSPVRTYRPELILLGYDQRLPPGISRKDLPCPVKRARALSPEKYKTSVLARKHRKMVDKNTVK